MCVCVLASSWENFIVSRNTKSASEKLEDRFLKKIIRKKLQKLRKNKVRNKKKAHNESRKFQPLSIRQNILKGILNLEI